MSTYQDFLASKAIRAKAHGLTRGGRQYWKRAPEDRFWEKVIPEPNSGCWLWIGALQSGYGAFGVDGGKIRRAHRLAYEWTKGPIPEGLDLDHLCRVRCCVNPDHLEPVTRSTNVSRGLAPGQINTFWQSKTHCPKGHLYSGSNLGIKPSGARYCRECNRAAWRAWKAGQS